MAIRLPSGTANGSEVVIESPANIVVIGANGSGKTRFGIWLEENNQASMPVHRLSAQKALAIPEFAAVLNVEQAEKDLFYGRRDEHASVVRKRLDRWGGTPANFLQSDYEKLLSLLFARDSQRDRNYTQKSRASGQFAAVEDSPIDQIVKLWGYLMPQRSISFEDGKVQVGKGTSAEYHAKEMSDGERVTLYLIGQCLCAPGGALIVVDEPELHLHRSLMDKLWNKVEELCPDKSFVYITHDLDFAASRVGAKKLWIQSYSGNAWEWTDVPDDEILPEALVLEIIGNRKPLLFCEGDRGGLDHAIYQRCFPHFHVIPRGGSEKVIESTKAISSNAALHRFSASGIVDRDVRSANEIATLEAQGVQVLVFAEIENVLCAEELVVYAAAKLSLDPNQVLAEVRAYVAEAIQSELETQISLRAARQIRYRMSCYSPASTSEVGLEEGVTTLLAGLNVAEIIEESRVVFANAISSGSLNEMLKIYNRKSLASRISACFGLQFGKYPDFVLRLLRGADGEELSIRISQLLPRI